MWGTVLSVGANLLGGAMQADSAENAANTQAGASREAVGEQRRQFDISREDLAPWRDYGALGVRRLQELLGVGSSDFVNSHLLRTFRMEDFDNDPVIKKSFEFGLSEGEKAVRRMFGAKGMSRSGAAVKAATRFAEDYAGQKAGESRDRYIGDQTNVYNRLAGLAGTGQTAATQTGVMGANAATNIGNLLVGEGNARGAASIAQGNAWAGALNNVGNTIGDTVAMGGRGGRTPSWSTPPYIPPVTASVPGQFNLDTYG